MPWKRRKGERILHILGHEKSIFDHVHWVKCNTEWPDTALNERRSSFFIVPVVKKKKKWPASWQEYPREIESHAHSWIAFLAPQNACTWNNFFTLKKLTREIYRDHRSKVTRRISISELMGKGMRFLLGQQGNTGDEVFLNSTIISKQPRSILLLDSSCNRTARLEGKFNHSFITST